MENYDKLMKKTFVNRQIKLAALFDGPVITNGNINSWIDKLLKLTREMQDIVEEYDLEEDGSMFPPEYSALREEHNAIKKALDNFDDNWMIEYFIDNGELPDEIEFARTMKEEA